MDDKILNSVGLRKIQLLDFLTNLHNLTINNRHFLKLICPNCNKQFLKYLRK